MLGLGLLFYVSKTFKIEKLTSSFKSYCYSKHWFYYRLSEKDAGMNFEGRIMRLSFLRGESEEEIKI
jgi:hypothetical protein